LAAASLKRFGANSRLLEPPRHLVMFDQDSLRALLERTGFTGIELLVEPRRYEFVVNQSRMMELGVDPHSTNDAVAPTELQSLSNAPIGKADPNAEIITMIAFKAKS
jgi:hypothetical protein